MKREVSLGQWKTGIYSCRSVGRFWFVVFALALASAAPGAWRAWSAASAGRWYEFGDGVLFWLTWEGDPGGRRILIALGLSVAALTFAALAQHSARGWIAAPARLIHAFCKPWAALAALALALLPHAVAPALRPDADDKPSVVLILLDTVRLDHVGWGGSELPTTPRLDALAREGAVFTQAIAQAPWTKPSVGTLLTGLTPGVHGATGRFTPMPEERRMLAEAFAAAGYDTFGVSSNPNISRLFRFEQGFGEFHESTAASADQLIEQARVWIRPGEGGGRPFFLYMHLNDAHYPYDPPESSTTSAGTQPIRGLFNRSGRTPRLDGEAERAFRNGGGISFTESDVESMRLSYAEEIRWLDDQVGDLIEKLLAVRDDVLVVICADHGEEFLEHGDLGHGHSLHEELVRVPLQFAWSRGLGERQGWKPGVRGQQVRLMDVPPTLLQMAGLGWPEAAGTMQGTSLSPLLRGDLTTEALAFAETDYLGSPLSGYGGPLRMLREPGTKIVISDPWFEQTAGHTWLFDLRADPGEHRNVAAQQPDLLQRLRAALDRSGWVFERDLTDVGEAELTEEQRAVLASMGYAGDNPEKFDPMTLRLAPGAVPWVQDPR